MPRGVQIAVLGVLLTWPTLKTLALAETTTWHDIGSPEIEALTDIEVTPWGLMAAESAPNLNGLVYNGVYLSKDFGLTWTRQGLENKGVRDIKYYGDKVYAATYYSTESGSNLYASSNTGLTWTNIGPQGSGSKVDRDSVTLYSGMYTKGLWISKDNGDTWTKVSDPTWGTYEDIIGLVSSEELTIASTPSAVFITTDHGDSWNKINFLNNKIIRHISISGTRILASGYDTKGLYISNDSGITWVEIPFFSGFFVGDTEIVDNQLFAARKKDKLSSSMSIYTSDDGGTTWLDTSNSPIDYNIKNFTILTSLNSFPGQLFTTGTNLPIYKHNIKASYNNVSPFLRIPWNYESASELVNKISSFFDHSYPLLGSILKEPVSELNATLNFLGLKGSEPEMYYSSHNGIDFEAPYGSEVIAAAAGDAYYYYCTDCGHSIRIKHDNGYESTYMHMQYNGLINYSPSNSVYVNEGQVIGLVGMTGKSSGPHIHFSLNKTGVFPYGLTDPYGWLNTKIIDPWKNYLNMGQSSEYVWKDAIPEAIQYNAQSNSIELDAIKVSYDSTSNVDTALKLTPYAVPRIEVIYPYLKYVPGTSALLNMVDNFGQEITQLESGLTLEFDISNLNLQNIDVNTLRVYFFDTLLKTWIPLESVIDLANNKVTAVTAHLSWFALFGQKEQLLGPTTSIDISGNELILSATAYGGAYVDKIFYSVNGSYEFVEYTEPIYLPSGITNVQFRSLDSAGNLEVTKNQVVLINTGQFQKKINIKSSVFSIL